MLDAACSGVFHLLSDEPYVIQVAIVTGFHLFPFRTEKLSPSAPMVLHTRGRVGSRRFYERGANSSNACPLLFSFSESLELLETLESLERLGELEGSSNHFGSCDCSVVAVGAALCSEVFFLGLCFLFFFFSSGCAGVSVVGVEPSEMVGADCSTAGAAFFSFPGLRACFFLDGSLAVPPSFSGLALALAGLSVRLPLPLLRFCVDDFFLLDDAGLS